MSSESCQVSLSISSKNARASEEDAISRLISRASRAWYLTISPRLQASVVQKMDNAIHWINHYPVDNAIGLRITYPLDSDISGGYTCSSIQLMNNRGQIESLFPGYTGNEFSSNRGCSSHRRQLQRYTNRPVSRDIVCQDTDIDLLTRCGENLLNNSV